MSKINMAINMKEKTVDVVVDKNKLENVVGVYASKYIDYDGRERVGCTISTMDEKDGVRRRVDYSHESMPESTKAEAENRVVDKTISGWVGYTELVSAHDDLQKYFQGKL